MAIPLLFLLFSLSLAPSSHGATKPTTTTCSSYKFTTNATFSKCTNLDHLSASLHWTYNSDGSLSIAYVAPPASPSGWVAWGINPTSLTMLGTQALVAFKEANGSMTVKTYNLTSYTIQESPILYETSDLSSVFGSDGKIALFAKLKIGKSLESVNQIYQVGSSVTNGVPDKHAMNPDNMGSKAELALAGTKFSGMEPASAPSEGGMDAGAPGAPGAPSAGGAHSPTAGSNAAAACRSRVSGFWSVLVVLLVVCIVRF